MRTFANHFFASCLALTFVAAAPTTTTTTVRPDQYVAVASEDVAAKVASELGQDLVTAANITGIVVRNLDGTASILLVLPAAGRAQLTPGKPYEKDILQLTQGPTVYDTAEGLARTIGTLSIKVGRKTVTVDFLITAKPLPEESTEPYQPNFAASVVWGAVKVYRD